MTIDVRTLFTAETAASLLSTGLELAKALGLPVTSWRAGDPSRTLYKWLAEALATRDSVVSEFIKAGWIRSATGAWKTLVAQDVYGVTRTPATYATPSVTLANGKGAVYSKAAGEVIVKSSTSGVSFRSTEALSLASGPGTSATIALVADVAGSAGTVNADDIDEIVTTMLGVSITSSTAAIGTDEQSDESLETECFATLGRASSNGPPDAYNATVLDEDLTGDATITRATTTEDAADGTVTVYVATATGAPAPGAVAAAQGAVELWATPATVTPTVVAATPDAQTVAYNVSGDDIPATAEEDIEALVIAYYATIAIGGYVSASALVSLAHEYLTDADATSVEVELTSPSGGTLSEGVVATVASVTVTEV